MNSFNKYTPVRIIVPFVLGIACALSFRIGWSGASVLLVMMVCFLCLLFAYIFLRTNYNMRWIPGSAACLSLFFTGCCMITATDQKVRQQLKYDSSDLAESLILCRLDDSPVRKTRTSIGNGLSLAIKDSLGRWHRLDAKILVCFKGDSLCNSLGYGDLIVLKGKLQAIPGPPNPRMFDYRRYLLNRQICYQVFPDSGQWRRIGRCTVNPVRSAAQLCREKFMETLKKFRIEGQDFALVSALLLGRQELVENEVKQEFSHAGVIHVLSVSGLHVGIMYVVADKMFFFLKRNRKGRKLHAVLILCFIWAYSFITGMPASVMRAALMFSLFSVGKMFKRSPDNYNILAVAAFLQLCINPYEITQIGFLLSYLAVLGIFAFYLPFYNLIYTGNKLITWTWALLAVSIAAQIATFPLACYYFNMFPVYFLLANLVVVPLAAVVTYFTLPLLLIGAAGLTFEWIALPLKWSLWLMRGSVEIIQSWPGAVIEPIVLTSGQTLLIYAAIISFFGFWVLAERRWVFVIPASLILFSVISAGRMYERSSNSEIIIYQVPGHTAVDLIYNRQAQFICDSLLKGDQKIIDFQIKPNRVYEGVREIREVIPDDSCCLSSPGLRISFPFIYFRGKTMAFIGSDWDRPHRSGEVRCDLAVISGNPHVDPGELLKHFKIREWIIDSSVPFYKAEQLLQSFEKENIPCHSVRQEGAYVLKW